MAGNPELKVYVDWDRNGNFTGTHDDVSAYATGEPGDRILRIGRSVDFDGGAGQPGACSVTLRNVDQRFTKGNASSPIAGKQIPGRPIRVEAIYNSTTYPLFDGVIRNIVPLPGRPARAELHAEDALFTFARESVSLALARSRSISEFRGAILDDIGEPAARRSLSIIGPESMRPPTGADQRDPLNVLGELNKATGSIHFVRPEALATRYRYVVKDRVSVMAGASVATYAKAESWGNYRVSDDSIVNVQTVEAQPWLSSESEELLWQRDDRIAVPAGKVKTLWARWSSPLIMGTGRRPAERTRFDHDGIDGTLTRTITFFNTSAKLELNGGASGGFIRKPRIYGHPAVQTGLGAVEARDAASITSFGEWHGDEIASEFIDNESQAEGLAAYKVFRYSDPRGRPVVMLFEVFPDVLVREPGERIIASNDFLGVASMSLLVASTELTMAAGGHWRLALGCEEAPGPVNTVTIGGTAAQGIGGSAILGY